MPHVNGKIPVLWVDDWPLKAFFFQKYIEDQDISSSEGKMEILWSLVQKILLAREAVNRKITEDTVKIREELENLLKEETVEEALLQKEIEKEDLLFFLRIENLQHQILDEIQEKIRQDMKKNPDIVRELYEKNREMVLRNVYRILEVWVLEKGPQPDEKLFYSEEDLRSRGWRIKSLGTFSEEELKKIYPEEYGLVGKKEGSIIPIDTSGGENLYYFIQGFYPEYRQSFEEIQGDFEDFVFHYLLEEFLNKIYEHLMDKYLIRYNEECLNKIFQE